MKYLAVNIRGLRQDHRISLDGLAKLAHCSKSLLSKIETGKIIPTLATLSRIAEALGTDAGSLLQKSSEAKAVMNSNQDHVGRLVKSEKGYQFFPFALDFGEKLIQPFLFVVEKGKVKQHRVSHAGHEWMFLLEGKIKFHVGQECFVMGPQDSLYFDPNLPHGVEPISAKAIYLAIFTHPQHQLKTVEKTAP